MLLRPIDFIISLWNIFCHVGCAIRDLQLVHSAPERTLQIAASGKKWGKIHYFLHIEHFPITFLLLKVRKRSGPLVHRVMKTRPPHYD